MKKKILSVVLAILVLTVSFSSVFSENETTEEVNTEMTTLSAKSPHVVVADQETGMIIYKKGADERVYPADLTKIMTAVLVLENCKLEEIATASETALSNVSSGSSKLGIIKEEKLSVRQLLYAMLLGNAADAANVLAEKTSGSIEEFVKLMNERAKELGMENTNFTNPSGDHDERHYTTAADMTKLSVCAMAIADFKEIVKCDSYSIPATEKSDSARSIKNTNHLVSRLIRGDYYYKNATGMKTGYTTEAKHCIAASAEKDGMSLIALVFEAENVEGVAQSYKDCSDMFEFVFNNYLVHRIVQKGDILAQTEVVNTRRTSKLILKADKPLSVLYLKTEDKPKVTYKDTFPAQVSAPVTANQVIGTREYFVGNESIGVVNLVADKNYALDPITFIVNKMIAFVTSPWLFVTIALVITAFILYERRRRKLLRQKRREERAKRSKLMIEEIDKL